MYSTTDSIPSFNTAEAVLDNIRSRRNVKEFDRRDVDHTLIELIIEAATWAPNHRHTEPWRFIVLPKGGTAREKVAQLVYDWTYQNVKNPSPERRTQSAEAIRNEVLNIPAMLYIYSIPGDDEEITQENYAAACCAAQNMLLAAHAHGLAVGWSTGRTCKCEEIHPTIGADPSWNIVGAFSIGYPKKTPTAKRMNPDKVTIWLN